jgi:hypothetical protein
MDSGLTEDLIERKVERAFDRLDAAFLAGKITQAEYEAQAEKIHAWSVEAALPFWAQDNGDGTVSGDF